MRVTFFIFVFAYWCAFLLTGSCLKAQAGVFDPEFGDGGKAVFDANEYYNLSDAIAVQPDGKILLAGTTGTGDIDYAMLALARLLPDGSPDLSFGDGGSVVVAPEAFVFHVFASDIFPLPDGKIVVIGDVTYQSGASGQFLMRFHADGSIDDSFGTNGRTIFPGSGCTVGNAFLQPDGKFVMTGGFDSDTSYLDIVVYRVTPEGQPDNTFGDAGRVTTSLGTLNDVGTAVAVLPDGKILVVGHKGETIYSSDFDMVMLRYLPDGSLDDSFGTGGVVVHSFSETQDDPGDFVIMPDGKILTTGYFQGEGGNYDFALVRCQPNGALDNTFGDGGFLAFDLGNTYDLSLFCVRQSDGKIIVGGASTAGNGQTSPALVRFNADFTPDSTFGTNGVLMAGVGNDIEDGGFPSQATLQPDGKLVFCTFSEPNAEGKTTFCAMRVLTQPQPSASDSPEGSNDAFMLYPNPAVSETVVQYALEQDETLTMALFDLYGRHLQTFLSGTLRRAGEHRETLRLANELPPGSYLLRIGGNTGQTAIRLFKK